LDDEDHDDGGNEQGDTESDEVRASMRSLQLSLASLFGEPLPLLLLKFLTHGRRGYQAAGAVGRRPMRFPVT